MDMELATRKARKGRREGAKFVKVVEGELAGLLAECVVVGQLDFTGRQIINNAPVSS